jgi:hypothetical protein
MEVIKMTPITTPKYVRQQLLFASARACSAWKQGVIQYAHDILDNLQLKDDECFYACMSNLLGGAMDWTQASEGGSYYIYDEDIATRLCTPATLRKHQERPLFPERANSRETWLAVQARALFQAAHLIIDIARKGSD